MNELRLGGERTSALTHFAMFGLAAILEDAGHRPVRLWWSEERKPAPYIGVDATWDEVASCVQAHAARAAADDSWVNATVNGTSVQGRPLYSPRASTPQMPEWPEFERQRHEAMPPGRLDRLMIAALGEPAWWRVEEANTADGGASRWEMKTRNRGQEFLGDRLALLARAVGRRSVDDVRAGLSGEALTDEVGGSADVSRTPTGLTTPRLTDNALAWCALWGLVVVPPVRHVWGFSASPGVWPRTRTHPDRAVVPMWTTPVSVWVIRTVMTSKNFDAAAFAAPSDPFARAALQHRGVRALMRFPVHVGGSASAPERMLLTGQLDVL